MSCCVLHVSGEDFDVDAYLAESTLRPYDVHHRGDQRYSMVAPDSGFSLDVSDADGDLKAQVADAIRLLAEWEPELQRLRAFDGVQDIRLDFGYYRRDDVFMQGEYLPPRLLALAGRYDIGIALSLYPVPTPNQAMERTPGSLDSSI
jgi:hypothetical protein